MISIEVSADFRELSKAIRNFADDQIPFATSKALNETGKDARDAVRARVSKAFNLRSRGLPRLITSSFSNKRDFPFLEVEVRTPKEGRFDFFGLHEFGGFKKPTKGKRLAIPTSDVARKRKARGGFRGGFGPRDLVRSGKGRVTKSGIRGKLTKRGKDQRLFTLARRAKIKPTLEFRETAIDTAQRRFPRRMLLEMRNATRTRRRR